MAINPAAFSEYDPSYMASGYMTPFGESGITAGVANFAANAAVEIWSTRLAYGTFASGLAQSTGMSGEAFSKLSESAFKKQNFLQRWFGSTQPGLRLAREQSTKNILGKMSRHIGPYRAGEAYTAAFEKKWLGLGKSAAQSRRPVAAMQKAFAGDKVMTEAFEQAIKGRVEFKLPFMAKPIGFNAGVGTAKFMELGGMVFHGAAKFFGAQAVLGVAAAYGDIREAITAYGRQTRKQNEFTMTEMAGQFFDNRGAATMRQRSIAAIHNTQSQLRQVFGREATVVHS